MPEVTREFMKFSTAIPRNTISSLPPALPGPDLEHRCDHCGKPATLHCKRCPDTDRSYYCSRKCYKSDWLKWHKSFCANKRFYALTRNIRLTQSLVNAADQDVINAVQSILDEACTATGIFASNSYLAYLYNVDVSQRPVTMLGNPPHSAYISQAAYQSLQCIRKVEPLVHQVLHEAMIRYKYPTKHISEVPLEMRPAWAPTVNGVMLPRGIPLFPQDYQQLSFGFYEHYWGAQRPMSPLWDVWGEGLILLHERLSGYGAVLPLRNAAPH